MMKFNLQLQTVGSKFNNFSVGQKHCQSELTKCELQICSYIKWGMCHLSVWSIRLGDKQYGQQNKK